MAKGFEVDFVSQTVTILDASVIDADGAKEIATLQQAGYKTVQKRKQTKRQNRSKGKNLAYYENALSADEFKKFQQIKAEKGFFGARKYAEEVLAK